MVRRTKIVATLGPATSDEEALRRLLRAGVDVVRLNFSHGNEEEHGHRCEIVRKLAREMGRPVGVLLDLQGPKIRIGKVAGKGIHLEAGRDISIRTGELEATVECLVTPFRDLPRVVSRGQRILLDDGLVELEVTGVEDDVVACRVVVGGRLTSHKGMNLPDTETRLPSLTDKDRNDLEAGLRIGVDMVALSFVRTAADVRELRSILLSRRAATPVVAKIEKPQAVVNIREILEIADGIMVARGDLGVEMSPGRVPVIQKKLLREAHRMGRFAITATQMLQSMVHNPRPTRAEASDVANAIFDGTDAVMLSEETAAGQYPVESVEQMVRIANWTEPVYFESRPGPGEVTVLEGDEGDRSTRAICQAAVDAARALQAKALVVFTRSGRTARILASMRPRTPIAAFTYVEATSRFLCAIWGVTPLVMPKVERTRDLIVDSEPLLKGFGIVEDGDLVVVIAGTSVAAGAANMMKVHRIGDGLEGV